MAFLFDKKTKQGMKWIWIFFSIIIIFSMTLAFSGGQGLVGGGAPQTPTQTQQEQPVQSAEDMTVTPGAENIHQTATTTNVEVDDTGEMQFEVEI